MFKSNKGFTLVELIVVIAILAILAGVAIPVYNGYIKRAQDAAVVTELDAIQTAAQAANATSGQITKIVVSADGTSIKVAGEGNKLASGFDSDFCLFYDNASDDSADSIGILDTKKAINLGTATYVTGATWKDGKWQPGTEDVDPQSSGSSLNTDSGNTDSGNTDSGNTDSGNTDSGNTDSGNTDSGNTDSGNTDSGNTDSGNTDSGNTDSGNTTGGNYETEDAPTEE